MSDLRPAENPVPVWGRRWLGPALLVSLVINLFLLGTIAAALLFHRPPKDEGFDQLPPPVFRFLQKGVERRPDDRAAVRSIMIQQFPIVRPYIDRIEAARKELADAVGATPYDPVRVRTAFETVDRAQAEMVQATREAMVQGFGKLDREQRERLAEAMRKQAAHRMKRDDRGPPPPPDALPGGPLLPPMGEGR